MFEWDSASAGVRCLSDLRNIKPKPIAKQAGRSEDSQDINVTYIIISYQWTTSIKLELLKNGYFLELAFCYTVAIDHVCEQ